MTNIKMTKEEIKFEIARVEWEIADCDAWMIEAKENRDYITYADYQQQKEWAKEKLAALKEISKK